MKVFQSKKRILLHDMVAIQKFLANSAEYHDSYADTWAKMGETLKNMIVSQNSAISDQMERFAVCLKEIADCHKRITAAETRNSEDFNDVIERYEVLYRTHNEYLDAKKKFQNANAKLREALDLEMYNKARPDWDKLQEKTEINVTKCKEAKVAALEDTKVKLATLIETRKKYNLFKVRRFRQGWIRYGTTLKTESENEIEIINKIQGILNEIRGIKDVNPEDLNKIETAVTKQLEEAPQPQFTPDAESLQQANTVTDLPAESDHMIDLPEVPHDVPEIPEEDTEDHSNEKKDDEYY